jgi:hypothetical protein
VAILGNAIIDHALSGETLNDGDINPSSWATSPAADSADGFGG